MCLGENLEYEPVTPAEISPQSPPSAEVNQKQEVDDFDTAFGGLLSAALRTHDPDARSDATTELAGRQREEPVLKVGSKLTSELRLRANRWMKVGRDPKSQLLVDCSGVSREHCAFRWDSHQRRVELRDNSVHGTFVNNMQTRHAIRVLQHGDRIVINGKGKAYTFVLDLRPVGLGFSDPCAHLLSAKSAQATASARADKRRAVEALKAELEKVAAVEKQIDEKTFEKEQEYYEILGRRQIRQQSEEVKQMELEQIRHDTKELEVKLGTSRKEWYKKLKADQIRTQQQVGPVIQLVSDLQMQLERMNLKRAEMERHIYPHRFGFIDSGGLMRLDRSDPPPSSPLQSAEAGGEQLSRSPSPRSLHRSVSGERTGSGHAPSSPYRNTDLEMMPPPASPSSAGGREAKRGRGSPDSGGKASFDNDKATSPPIKGKADAATPNSDEKLETMIGNNLVELHKIDEEAYVLGRELFGDFDSEEEQDEDDEAERFWADFDSKDKEPVAKRAKLL